jgi:SecD/SecF fusion protein
MVKDLGVEEQPAPTRQPAAAGASRPAGGRRARSRANGDGDTPPTAPPSPPTAGNGGDDTGSKERKPRNKRHGRPR